MNNLFAGSLLHRNRMRSFVLPLLLLCLLPMATGQDASSGAQRAPQPGRKWVRVRVGGGELTLELPGALREIHREPEEARDVSDSIREFRFIDSHLIVRVALMKTSLEIEADEPSLKMVSDGLLLDFLSSLTNVEGTPGEFFMIDGIPALRRNMDFEIEGRPLAMRSVLLLDKQELAFVLTIFRRTDEEGRNLARRIVESVRYGEIEEPDPPAKVESRSVIPPA